MKVEHINIRVSEEEKALINKLRGEKTITQFLMELAEAQSDRLESHRSGIKHNQ
jgi:uncharacterized protein (DUF1778 family)